MQRIMSAEPIVTLSVARTLSAAIGAAFRRSDRASARRDSRGRRACASARRASTRRRPAARCAPSAGLGRALARQAAPGAGLSRSVASATVNKVRGSGMRAIRHAFDAPANGSADVAAAGGMARSSNGPYRALGVRGGYRSGHAALHDHVAPDGLADAGERGTSMGEFGQRGAPRLHACRSRRVRGRIAAMGAACATGDRADVTPLARGGTAPRQRFRRRGATPSDAD
ncbi:acetyl-CoA acetyltransferase [Burkholderia pseudomallei]|nr:acetyl-CoA acetyltransferase [Burkholderia pseudomallei]APZ12083.1 acetyl-CoA acetyltransferase [Burkholderia pseudomallei]